MWPRPLLPQLSPPQRAQLFLSATTNDAALWKSNFEQNVLEPQSSTLDKSRAHKPPRQTVTHILQTLRPSESETLFNIVAASQPPPDHHKPLSVGFSQLVRDIVEGSKPQIQVTDSSDAPAEPTLHSQIKELLDFNLKSTPQTPLERPPVALIPKEKLLVDRGEGSLWWLAGRADILAVPGCITTLDVLKRLIRDLQHLRSLETTDFEGKSDVVNRLLDDLGLEAAEVIADMQQWSDKLLAQLAVHKEAILSRKLPSTDNLQNLTSSGGVFVPGSVQTDVQKRFEKKKNRARQDASRQNVVREEDEVEAVLLTLGIVDPDEPSPVAYKGQSEVSKAQKIGTEPVSSLPSDAVTKHHEKYTEVFIPARKAFTPDEESLYKVADVLPEWGQEVFKGMDKLNFIQSRVFECAFKGNDNLLMSAPTGAGKTNVALLTILRAVSQSLETRGTIPHSKHFKIVYVAPLKSLVAEIADKFSARLEPLGMKVAEFTGDMPLTRVELETVHLIVTVPEKWDVLTRNSRPGEDTANALSSVKLLIFDEVHLVGEDRGPVLEAIVARSFSHMLASQTRHRIVALSATLPNWRDVADFLEVLPRNTYVFDDSFRPIPLEQTILGVKGGGDIRKRNHAMNLLCYERMARTLREGHQAMIFVHSRGDTFVTAETMIQIAQATADDLHTLFLIPQRTAPKHCLKQIGKCGHQQLRGLLEHGVGVHHAGIGRSDRRLVENLFREGGCRLLVCTATLAWGVNLPARMVIIKGTNVFNADKGGFSDLEIIDVLQIFGRAGRPQYDSQGRAVLITTHDKYTHYVDRLMRKLPLESKFLDAMPDHLNAEIAIGSVGDIESASQWFRHTFAFVRMRRNPKLYQVEPSELMADPTLFESRRKFVLEAAKLLYNEHLIRIGNNFTFSSTGLGRIAARYYVHHRTAHIFNQALDRCGGEGFRDIDVLLLVSEAAEFAQLKVRDEETSELAALNSKMVKYRIPSTTLDDVKGKVAVLIQAYISKASLVSFSLLSDTFFVTQSFGRLLRAFAEIAMVRQMNISALAASLLEWAKVVERRIWRDECPLRHFCVPAKQLWSAKAEPGERDTGSQTVLKSTIVDKLEAHSMDELMHMTTADIASIIRLPAMAPKIFSYLRRVPNLQLRATIQPITQSILKITCFVLPLFEWSDRWHGKAEPFKVWLEDPHKGTLLHVEDFLLKKESVKEVPHCLIPGNDAGGYTRLDREAQEHEFEVVLSFAVPIREPRPPQYILSIVSERWVGVKAVFPFALDHLLLPNRQAAHTNLLPLNPIPVKSLQHPVIQSLFKFSFFNPIQSQVFHTLYHNDTNVLIGAPTGSGKTICAEFAIFRLFQVYPKRKVVYIAPLKALAKERLDDWTIRLKHLGKAVVELSGDFTPDVESLKHSDLIITTPEKWDGISRHWQHRSYVRQVGLVVIDEIHLLGQDRGPILEVIVSRMRYVSAVCDMPIRFVGLSTALANATDIADWLGIGRAGLFNFRPAVRPVPCSVYVAGFSEKAYCPRMGTMNKPAYQQILAFSPDKPVLVFVSSRRQTRLTATELVMLSRTGSAGQTLNFLHTEMSPEVWEANVLATADDDNLRETLRWGVGMHHAGLNPGDRRLCEKLFEDGIIQVLVATSTLAWGVNLPARLVILKGTEFYDKPKCRYVDMPITDVLQMIGRAGRPQFDDQAVACIFIHEPKKQFYRRFLYEPFPVESSLHSHLTDHLNAEIVSQSIKTKRQAIDFLTWTYFFRRLHANPSYYDPAIGAGGTGFVELSRSTRRMDPHELLEERKREIVQFVADLVSRNISLLLDAGCIMVEERGFNVEQDLMNMGDYDPADRIMLSATHIGRIASLYYMKYRSAHHIATKIDKLKIVGCLDMLTILTDTEEFFEVPVRHNEDIHNEAWSKLLPLPVDQSRIGSGHVKAFILFQMQMFRMKPPIVDYYVDCQTVLQNAIRLIQAFADLAAEKNCLSATMSACHLLQYATQATNPFRSPLYCLPHIVTPKQIGVLENLGMYSAAQLLYADMTKVHEKLTHTGFSDEEWNEFMQACAQLPRPTLNIQLMKAVTPNDPDGVQISPTTILCRGIPTQTYLVNARDPLVITLTVTVEYGCQQPPKNMKRFKRLDRAYTPHYPKERQASWWCMIGDPDIDELVGFKRLNVRNHGASLGYTSRSRCTFLFQAPALDLNEPKDLNLRIYVLSDVYVGFDQEIFLTVRVNPTTCQRDLGKANEE